MWGIVVCTVCAVISAIAASHSVVEYKGNDWLGIIWLYANMFAVGLPLIFSVLFFLGFRNGF